MPVVYALSAQQMHDGMHATVKVCTLRCRNSGKCQCVLDCRGKRSGAGWARWPRLCRWVIGSLQITGCRVVNSTHKKQVDPELPVRGWPGLGLIVTQAVAQF